MPQVPTRTSFTEIEGGVGNVRTAAPQLRGVDGGNLRPTQFRTPEIRAQDQAGFRATTPVQAGVSPEQASLGARQGKALAGVIQGAGEDVGRLFLDMQNTANAVVADDAVNKLTEVQQRLTYGNGQNGTPLGFTALKGYDALFRADDKPLADEYSSQFDDAVTEIEGGLKNDAQRLAFRAQSDRMRVSFRNAATQHTSQEFKTYNLSVQKGVISSSMEDIALNYTDPEITGTVDMTADGVKGTGAFGRLLGAVAQQGMLIGKSAGEIKEDQRAMVSVAHRKVVGAALQGDNVVYADAYLKQHADEMTADDLLATNSVVTKEMDGRLGLLSAQDAVRTIAPRLEPTDMDRVINITAMSESGNRDFTPGGAVVTSPKGARGRMQVMPATAADPGHGIKPSDGTREGDARVGRELMGALVKKYKGDMGLAWASYNWGEGNVDKVLKETKGQGANAWFDKVPGETKAYVTKNLKQLSGGEGRPSTPTLEDVQARIYADPRVNSSPSRLQVALAEGTRQWQVLNQGRKDREEAVVSDAYRAISEGATFDTLPVALRNAIPGDKIPQLRSFSNTMGKGPERSDNATYLLLTDPSYLGKLTNEQFMATRSSLTESDWQHFAQQRQKAPTDNAATALNTEAINTTVNSRLLSMGLPTGQDKKNEEGVARAVAIRKYVREAALVQQGITGKKMTDAEVELFVDKLWTQNTEFRETVMGFDFGDTKQGQLLNARLSDIPTDRMMALRAAFKAKGILEPSDADLLAAYFRKPT